MTLFLQNFHVYLCWHLRFSANCLITKGAKSLGHFYIACLWFSTIRFIFSSADTDAICIWKGASHHNRSDGIGILEPAAPILIFISCDGQIGEERYVWAVHTKPELSMTTSVVCSHCHLCDLLIGPNISQECTCHKNAPGTRLSLDTGPCLVPFCICVANLYLFATIFERIS